METQLPTKQPLLSRPIYLPSRQPSSQPLIGPSNQPSLQPSINPSSRPLSQLDGLCSLIRSTKIGSYLSEYQCTLSRSGEPKFITNPCSWRCLGCDSSNNIFNLFYGFSNPICDTIFIDGSLPNNFSECSTFNISDVFHADYMGLYHRPSEIWSYYNILNN